MATTTIPTSTKVPATFPGESKNEDDLELAPLLLEDNVELRPVGCVTSVVIMVVGALPEIVLMIVTADSEVEDDDDDEDDEEEDEPELLEVPGELVGVDVDEEVTGDGARDGVLGLDVRVFVSFVVSSPDLEEDDDDDVSGPIGLVGVSSSELEDEEEDSEGSLEADPLS